MTKKLCSLVLLIATAASTASAALAQTTNDGAPFADGLYSNPYQESSKKGFGAYLRMRMFGGHEWADYKANAHLVPISKTNTAVIQTPNPDVLQATWIGHATVLIQYKGKTVLTDPIFSKRASPFSFTGPARVTQPGYSIEELPPVDLIVISHNHYDHLDKKSLTSLASKTKHIAVPLGVGAWIKSRTPFSESHSEFDWWQSKSIEGIEVTATPSQHWSGRSTTDRYKTLWAAWAVTIEDKTVWFGGDTGYNDIQFKQIGERFKRIDLGIIPIGAYAPRGFMKMSHVNPEEAVSIHQDVGAVKSIGVHWGTFALTAEPIDEPPARLKRALAAASIVQDRFKALAVGETLTLP